MSDLQRYPQNLCLIKSFFDILISKAVPTNCVSVHLHREFTVHYITSSLLASIFCFTKELSFCHKIKSSDPNIFATWWCKPVIFQTYIIVSTSINRLKNVRSKTLGYKDMEIRKSEFVAKTQLLKVSLPHCCQ